MVKKTDKKDELKVNKTASIGEEFETVRSEDTDAPEADEIADQKAPDAQDIIEDLPVDEELTLLNTDDNLEEVADDATKEVISATEQDQRIDYSKLVNVGDTIKLFYRIKEGNKTRIQPYEGLVICKKGSTNSRTLTVRRIAYGGVGVERIIPFNSPNLDKITIVKKGKVRRAKLYYLRSRVGKGALKVNEAPKHKPQPTN